MTAWLSAIHLIGFTLVMGGALLANLRLLGVLLRRRAVVEVTEPASRAIALGLAISITTGLLLFSGRAATVIENSMFQLKIMLLLAAALFHFTLHARLTRRPEAGTNAMRTTAVLGLSLWMGLALAACAFILLE